MIRRRELSEIESRAEPKTEARHQLDVELTVALGCVGPERLVRLDRVHIDPGVIVEQTLDHFADEATGSESYRQPPLAAILR